MNNPLLKDPFNRDIVNLLRVSKLPVNEKKLWVCMLEYMSEQEKKDLIKNLEKEVEYEVKTEMAALEEFLKAFDAIEAKNQSVAK